MKLALTAIGIMVMGVLNAQVTGEELDPVTVTGSLQPKEVSGTGRNILVIKGDRFRNLPIHSVDELLRFVPGVEVQMRGPMGSQSDIVLRGGTFQQVLVLLDGVRINDPNTGHFNSYIPVVPAEIERIEVLKGASSAIYGSDAVGGVIQVITKTFAARQGEKKLTADAQVAFGEYGLRNISTGFFYQQGKTAIGAGWLNNSTNGQLQRGTRGYVDANTYSASVTHDFSKDLRLSFRAAYDSRDFAAQNFYTSFASDTANEKVSSAWTQLRLAYTGLRSHHLVFDASYKNVKDEYRYSARSVANESTSELLQFNLRDEWKLGSQSSLVTGAQLLRKSISSNDRGDHQLNQAGVFVLLNQSLFRGFTINPALRLEWNKLSGTELVPQVNMSYRYKTLLLRAGAGKTIRDADFTERFNNYNKTIVTSGRVGNPDLAAERSVSYELGADLFIAKKLKLSVTGFRRNHRKLIDYVVTPYDRMPRQDNLTPGSVYALASNISSVNTSGLELDLSYQQSFAGNQGKLTAGAGFVWLDSHTPDSVLSFYVSSHAKTMVNFFTSVEYRNLTLSVSGIYKTRLTQKADPIQASLSASYFVWHSKLAYSLYRKRLNCFVQMNNISNLQYSDLLGAVMPGRWFSGGLAFHFDR
ncbi:MAG: TonB-dependent receptor [Chitinophagaceae bacterium]|nr:MAG: TonB-dependent receptor [Chitinophagaceae bacterium]